MREVRQTRYGLDPEGEPVGDCFRACIASIFERDLEDVPDFMDPTTWGDASDWWPSLTDWTRDEYGLLPTLSTVEGYVAESLGIALGLAGELRRPHAVVVRGEDPIWNPGTGDATGLLEVEMVVSFSPTESLLEAMVLDRNEVRSWGE